MLTETPVKLTNNPELFTMESEHMRNRECFVIHMYRERCDALYISDARYQLFARGCKSLEILPPTWDALFQRTKKSPEKFIFYRINRFPLSIIFLTTMTGVGQNMKPRLHGQRLVMPQKRVHTFAMRKLKKHVAWDVSAGARAWNTLHFAIAKVAVLTSWHKVRNVCVRFCQYLDCSMACSPTYLDQLAFNLFN